MRKPFEETIQLEMRRRKQFRLKQKTAFAETRKEMFDGGQFDGSEVSEAAESVWKIFTVKLPKVEAND
jgi:hypothetical protein